MVFPSGSKTITIKGKYINPDGSPASGTVSITPDQSFADVNTNTIFTRKTIPFTLDANGSFSAEFAKTGGTATDVVPLSRNVGVTIVESIDGAKKNTWHTVIDTSSTDNNTEFQLADATEITQKPLNQYVLAGTFASQLSTKMDKAGGTFVGPVTYSDAVYVGTPTNPSNPTTKLYTDTQIGLRAAPLGAYTKSSSNTDVGVLNWSNDSATGYLAHFTLGSNTSATNAAFGIGTDKGSGSGILISHKNAGRGIDIGVQPGASHGLQISGKSSAGFPARFMFYPGSLAVSLRADSGAGFSDGNITAGSKTLTSATAAFVAGDVGKSITQLTSRGNNEPLGSIPDGTTITAVNSATNITMSNNATNTVNGILFSVAGRTVPDTQNLLIVQDESSATLTTLSKDGLTARGATASSYPLRVFGKASQAAPIFAAYDSGSNLLSYIGAKGHIMSGVKTALTTADMSASRFGMWLDDTVGATKIMFAAKDSAGNLRTGSIALT